MGKGYPVIVKISLPPNKQYQSGSSLLIQGDSLGEVEKSLDELCGTEGNGKVVLAAFAEEALMGGATAAISKPSASTPAAAPAAPAAAPESGDDEDPPASENQLKVLAKKTGQDIEELRSQNLTKSAVVERLKGAK